MSQSRQPKGVPVGGQYAENAHDEAGASLAPERSYVPIENIKVGDIVWDGDEAFAVSEIGTKYNPITKEHDPMLFSARGDFWALRRGSNITVFRDDQALRDYLDRDGY